ncbi:MAG TPA: hypothetical protein VKO18_13250, partial [Terriglobia bacterium]|nr:hypothetical protein [Terriglobia bacterium]
YNLVARMQITSDNVHGSAPFPAILGRDKPSLPDLEPMPLSNQTCFVGSRLFYLGGGLMGRLFKVLNKIT